MGVEAAGVRLRRGRSITRRVRSSSYAVTQLGPVVLAVDGSAPAPPGEAVVGWQLFAGLPVTVVTVKRWRGGRPAAVRRVGDRLHRGVLRPNACPGRRLRGRGRAAAKGGSRMASADVPTGDPARHIVACARERAASVIGLTHPSRPGCAASCLAASRGASCSPGAVFGADRARWRPFRSRGPLGRRTGGGRRLRLIASPGAAHTSVGVVAGASTRYARCLMTWRRRAISRLAAEGWSCSSQRALRRTPPLGPGGVRDPGDGGLAECEREPLRRTIPCRESTGPACRAGVTAAAASLCAKVPVPSDYDNPAAGYLERVDDPTGWLSDRVSPDRLAVRQTRLGGRRGVESPGGQPRPTCSLPTCASASTWSASTRAA